MHVAQGETCFRWSHLLLGGGGGGGRRGSHIMHRAVSLKQRGGQTIYRNKDKQNLFLA